LISALGAEMNRSRRISCSYKVAKAPPGILIRMPVVVTVSVQVQGILRRNNRASE
jgi:hypothetical protein